MTNVEIWNKTLDNYIEFHTDPITRGKYQDGALALLFEVYKKDLPTGASSFERFHKMFRQTDITGNGSIDMAMHRLISCCELERFYDDVISGELLYDNSI